MPAHTCPCIQWHEAILLESRCAAACYSGVEANDKPHDQYTAPERRAWMFGLPDLTLSILFLRQQSGLIPFQTSCLKSLRGNANAEAPPCLWEPGTSQPDRRDLGVKIRCPSRKRSGAFTYFSPSARSDFTGFLRWPHIDSYHKIRKRGHYLLLALQSSDVTDVRERHFF